MPVELNPSQRHHLRKDARRRGMPYGQVLRARIVLALADDPCVTLVALALGVDRKTVRYWRDRFLTEGRKGLDTRKRPGRPSQVDAVSRCHMLALACGKPADFGVEFRPLWTLDALHGAYHRLYPDLDPVSRSTLSRILEEAEIRPHRVRMWLHSPDPRFREKVEEICALYLRVSPILRTRPNPVTTRRSAPSVPLTSL